MNAGKTRPERTLSFPDLSPPGNAPVARVASRELLGEGMQLVIEHAGREYRLRVTSNGKLILTA